MRITLTKSKLAIAVLAVAMLVPATAWANHVFTDVPDDKFYAAPVEWAFDNGITTGKTPTLFAPDDNVTRGESVTFLKRYNDNIVEPADAALQAAVGAAQADADSNAADIAALPVGPTAGSSGLGSCNNDGTDTSGEFLPCSVPLSLGADGSHSVLLTGHISWNSFGASPAEGQCQLQRDGVPVDDSTINMGEVVDTTSGAARNYASVTATTEGLHRNRRLHGGLSGSSERHGLGRHHALGHRGSAFRTDAATCPIS